MPFWLADWPINRFPRLRRPTTNSTRIVLGPSLDGTNCSTAAANIFYKCMGGTLTPAENPKVLTVISLINSNFFHEIQVFFIKFQSILHFLGILRVETDTYGSRIRIKSQRFNRYLCFNKRKRITTRVSYFKGYGIFFSLQNFYHKKRVQKFIRASSMIFLFDCILFTP